MSRKFINDDTAMTLFQAKPEEPQPKPDKIQIELTKVTTKRKLPYQEKQSFFE